MKLKQIDLEQAKEARKCLKEKFSLFNESKVILAFMLLNEIPDLSPTEARLIYEEFNSEKEDKK